MMYLNKGQTIEQNMVRLLNTRAKKQIVVGDFTYGVPEVYAGEGNHNTKVILTPTGSIYTGTTEVQYRRLSLEEIYTGLDDLELHITNSTTKLDVLAELSLALGISVDNLRYESESDSLPLSGETKNMVFYPTDGHLLYAGAIMVSVKNTSVLEGYPTILDFALTENTARSSHAINMPAGIQAGDGILVFVTYDNPPNNTALPLPGGWQRWVNSGVGFTNNALSAHVFERVALGSDTLTLTIAGSASRVMAAVAVRLGNYHNTERIDSASVANNPTGTLMSVPTITAAGGNKKRLWFCGGGLNHSTLPAVPGEGWKELATATITAATGGARATVFYRHQEEALNDTGSFTVPGADEMHIGYKLSAVPAVS